MVRTSRVPSASSDSHGRLKTRKPKIQDGGQGNEIRGGNNTSGISSNQSTSPAVRNRHSPLNLSGSRKLPETPVHSKSLLKHVESNGEIQNQSIDCAHLICRKEVFEHDNAVCCNKCNRWQHQSCAGFNQSEYKLLNKGKIQDNLMWFCDGCVPQIRCFLQGRPQRESEHTNNTELCKKLDTVIEGFARMEKALVAKESNIEDIIEEKVGKYLSEQRDKEDRQCNLIFHNLPESDASDIEDKKSDDIDKVKSIFSNLEVDYTEISKPTRLGKKMKTDDGKERPRLLRVRVGDVNVKRQALAKAKELKNESNSIWKKVYITPDLTFKEREENRKLRLELNTRRDKGEEDLIIRNRRIVKGGRPFRDRADATGGSEEAAT